MDDRQGAAPDGEEHKIAGTEAPTDEAPTDEAPTEPVVVGWNTGVQWELPGQKPALPPAHGTVRILSVIGRSIDTFLRRPAPFVILALPTTIASAVASALSLAASGGVGPAPGTAPETPGAGTAGYFALFLVVGILGIALSLAMTQAADDVRAGRAVDYGAVVRRGLGRTVIAILSWIVMYLLIVGVAIGGAIVVALMAVSRSIPLVVIGAVGLLVVILWIALRWSLSTTAIALEPVGPLEALGRSRAVTRGNVWRIVAIYLLLAAVTMPLGIGIGILSFSITDPLPIVLLSGLAGLLTYPLFTIVSTTIFGDLTGRPEAPVLAGPGGLRALFAGVILAVGFLALAIAIPKIGPAIDRIALQAVPAQNRGVILAGRVRNPIDQCQPLSPAATFTSGQPIYVGGYFTRSIPRGESGRVDVYLNGRLANSVALTDPLRPVACFYESEPLVDASPATWRFVVVLNEETIAEGTFIVR